MALSAAQRDAVYSQALDCLSGIGRQCSQLDSDELRSLLETLGEEEGGNVELSLRHPRQLCRLVGALAALATASDDSGRSALIREARTSVIASLRTERERAG